MWTYSQSTGSLSHDGVFIALGYSGFGDGKWNGDMQAIRDVGPIPVGAYTIGEPFTDPRHGPVVMRLTPDPANKMYGRDGFLCHGDSAEHPGMASHGCIVLGYTTRVLIAASSDRRLEVVT